MTDLHIVSARNQDKKVLESGLCQCDIAERVGDCCGSIIVDTDWFDNHRKRGKKAIFEFIALSKARLFTDDDCPW
jgi:hypothetical protein